MWLSLWICGRRRAVVEEQLNHSLSVFSWNCRFIMIYHDLSTFRFHSSGDLRNVSSMFSLLCLLSLTVLSSEASQTLSLARAQQWRGALETLRADAAPKAAGQIWGNSPGYYLADASETHWGVPPNFETQQNVKEKSRSSVRGPG